MADTAQKMYLHLFNKVTDALTAMEKCNYGEAADLLRDAQAEAEEIYLDGESSEKETGE